MRIQFGNLPKRNWESGESAAGQSIRQPGRWASAILAILAGLVLLAIPVVVSIVHSILSPEIYPDSSFREPVIPWAGMAVIFFLCILAHELLHALLHPGFGMSDSTVLFIHPVKLQFGVYFEGRIPRARWIAMRLLPVLVLTFLPLAVFLILYPWMTFALETYLIILMLTNSLGSGGDLVAVLIVLRQVPPGGVLNFHRGRAYWLPADDQPPRPPSTINAGEPSANGDRS